MNKTVLLEVVHLLQDDTEGFCPIPHHIHIFFLLFAKNSIWISWVENWYRGKNWLVWEKSWRTLVAVATFINSITDHVTRWFQISHFFPIFSTIGLHRLYISSSQSVNGKILINVNKNGTSFKRTSFSINESKKICNFLQWALVT